MSDEGGISRTEPSVGNILGFSLLFRDRRVLLTLDGRSLAPGIALEHYEAEVPGVTFPFSGAASAGRFRHRRCEALATAVTVRFWALEDWLRARLEGRRVGGLQIEHVALVPRARLGSAFELPVLLLHATRPDGSPALALLGLVAVGAEDGGAELRVGAPLRLVIGFSKLADQVVDDVIRRLGLRARMEEAGPVALVDPVRHALLRPFAAAGWKAPSRDALGLHSIEFEPELVRITLGRSDAAPPPRTPQEAARHFVKLSHSMSPATQALGDPHADGDSKRAAFDTLHDFATTVVEERAVAAALCRVLTGAMRFRDKPRAIAAAASWNKFAPQDPAAQRALTLTLAGAGQPAPLARAIARTLRLPHPPRVSARLTLALGSLLGERLGDSHGALALLDPLVDRARTDPPLEDLLPQALAGVAMAHARLSPTRPEVCLRALEEALDNNSDTEFALHLLSGCANIFREHGEEKTALPLAERAAALAPNDSDVLDDAIDSAVLAGDEPAAIRLLRRRLETADATQSAMLRRQLVDLLRQSPDSAERTAARAELSTLLADEARAPDLLARAAELASEDGDDRVLEDALSILVAMEGEHASPKRRLTLATARKNLGDPAGAFEALRPLIERPGQLPSSLARLALQVAPPEDKDAIVDRLPAADAAFGAQALLERAQRQRSRRDKLADLRRAASLLEDPTPALQQLAEAAEPDDPQPFAELATARGQAGDSQAETAAWLEAALRHLKRGDPDRAAGVLSRVARSTPDDASVLLVLGLARARAGRSSEAVQPLGRAIELGLERVPAALQGDERLPLGTGPGALELEVASILTGHAPREVVIDLLGRAHQQAPDASKTAREAGSRLVDLLAASGHRDQALETALSLAPMLQGLERGEMLVRAAAFAPPETAAGLLAEACELGLRDDRTYDAQERALRESGQFEALEVLLRERLSDTSKASARGEVLRRLISLVREREPQAARDRTSDLIELYDQLLSTSVSDPDALLAIAELYDRRGDEDRAIKNWVRALRAMPADDARAFDPSLRIARRAAEDERPDDARDALLRALDLRPHDRAALELLASLAKTLGDLGALRRAQAGLLEQAATDDERATRALELARAELQARELPGCLEHLQAAAQAVVAGSPTHAQIARTWLEATALVSEDPRARPRLELELRARAELRAALGAQQEPLEIRAEARLQLELEHDQAAMATIEAGLRHHRGHPLLLSTMKEICAVTGSLGHYLEAVWAIIADEGPGETRDRLATEVAFSAMELEDADRTLAALDRLSADRAVAPELLDLRDWAIKTLGREDEELDALHARLMAAPDDEVLYARLHRAAGSASAYVDALLDLASRADDDAVAASLSGRALDAALTDARDPTSTVRAIRACVRSGATKSLHRAFPAISELIVGARDDGALADVVVEADNAAADGDESFAAHADVLLEEGLVEMPRSAYLHRALWTRLRRTHSEVDERATAGRTYLDDLTRRFELSAADRVNLYIGHADLLDRRRAARLLSGLARDHLADAERFGQVLDALEAGNHWPEILRLLEARVEQATEQDERVEVLKRLAHVCGDVLSDPATAIIHLERALELEPNDPDLLLALLDLHYERTDLVRAVELTVRVLDHVPMGDDAFAALAHRAADAAVARNDLDLARSLLERILSRAPEDERTLARRDEVAALSGDPEHRVRLLATIATRHGGSARLEALEERARLLAGPLDRVDEAIVALRTVVTEAPERQESVAALESLLRDSGRWSDLASLLESIFPRQRGAARSETLTRLAACYRDHLFDLPRAEQALRIALENLGSPASDADLAERLRGDLVEALEQQGRYVDLAIYLERELAPELEGRVERSDVHPGRIDLLGRLANVHREFLDDEIKAARIFERLERLGHLPDDGLATLARWYRQQQRHQDLVRILTLRSAALAESHEPERKAEVDQRIAELLEGPLGRPHEAAHYWLDAYLADPESNRLAGARARLLLAGTDAVVNVRKRLVERHGRTPPQFRPALLTLLGDVLAPHDDHEREAEQTYRKALSSDPDFAAAQEGLGRLLARQGRLELAVEPLMEAAASLRLDPARAAENAAIGARALFELGRADEAEALLRAALTRAPDAQRALLELARLFHRLDRPADESEVLDELSTLPLSSMLRAEVAYRRAMLLEEDFGADPHGGSAERARAYLLEAVGADANHVAARQVLLDLARQRGEWSVVAHMYYLAIRELAPGQQRATVHLDLAETYLVHLGDVESALRNIESAIQQAADDVVVADRTARLAELVPSPDKIAERFEQIAGGDSDLDDAARARLWLLAADLRMRQDDLAAAEAASQHVLDLPSAPGEIATAATRRLETLKTEDARELRQQRSGLLRLLDGEEQTGERLHLLRRLREIGRGLGDDDLVERVSLEQLELFHAGGGSEEERNSAFDALRELFSERGDYQKVVELYENLAARCDNPDEAAQILGDAARFAWHGLREAKLAVEIVKRAMALRVDAPSVLDAVGEVAGSATEQDLAWILDDLRQVAPERRGPRLTMVLSEMAARVGAHELGLQLLRENLQLELSPPMRLQALSRLDAALVRLAMTADRLPVLREAVDLAVDFEPNRYPTISQDLAETLRSVGDDDAALAVCRRALEHLPEHKGLVRLHAEILEVREDWGELALALEQLADLSLEDRERALWLTRAARIHLDHPELSSGQRAAIEAARILLLRAREVAVRADEPRAALLPLSFTERRWEEVLAVSTELRALIGDDNDVLVLAALTQALHQGQTHLAAAIGQRHDANVRQRLLWPGLRHVLAEVAAKGPLPKLDPVLAAGAIMAGGGQQLFSQLQAWAAGQGLHPGLALGLARLFEASGDGPMARNLYQVAAFMTPGGPVARLVSRLPLPQIPVDPLAAPGWSSLEERGVLRKVLVRVRQPLSGIRGKRAGLRDPVDDAEREFLRAAGAALGRFREPLGATLPVAWSSEPVKGGVGVRNEAEPCIVLSQDARHLTASELHFRLARAAASVAMGLAVIRDPGGAELVDVLDALGQLVNPAHEPSGLFAQAIADALAADTKSADIGSDDRAALAEELVHWLSDHGALPRLEAALARAETLLATRLCGRLDGALATIAHEEALGVVQGPGDATTVLRHESARWLLRALGLYS